MGIVSHCESQAFGSASHVHWWITGEEGERRGLQELCLEARQDRADATIQPRLSGEISLFAALPEMESIHQD